MTAHNLSSQRKLAIIAQTGRLNRVAFARTKDAKAGQLLVQGIIARALEDEALPATVLGLDAALTSALNRGTP